MQEDGQRGCGPNAIRELTMRRAFQGEETACAKIPRQKRV